MKTQILECEIIINSKKITIINSEMNIELEWDLELEKNKDNASLNIVFKNIKGNVSFSANYDNYKKNTKIDFSSDSSWTILSKDEMVNFRRIEPTSSVINFDEKRVIIEY